MNGLHEAAAHLRAAMVVADESGHLLISAKVSSALDEVEKVIDRRKSARLLV